MKSLLHAGALRRVLAALAMLTLAVLAVAGLSQIQAPRPAAAAHSFTQTIPNVTESFDDILPCVGPAHLTLTYNAVFHTTALPSGAFHFTFTQTGNFAATVQGNPASPYTGHFTIWDGGNVNQSSGTHTSTVHLH